MMTTDHEVKTLAAQLMAEHGLSPDKWTFGLNNKKRAIGQCGRVCGTEGGTIEISREFARLNPIQIIHDTLLHEIAHALAGIGAGHGPEWVAACKQIGAIPERLNRRAEAPRGRYQAYCQCNEGRQVRTMHRWPKRLKRCRHCRASLNFVDTKHTGDLK